jgi:hypothetical protein
MSRQTWSWLLPVKSAISRQDLVTAFADVHTRQTYPPPLSKSDLTKSVYRGSTPENANPGCGIYIGTSLSGAAFQKQSGATSKIRRPHLLVNGEEGPSQPSQPAASEQAPVAESPQNADKATTIPSGQSCVKTADPRRKGLLPGNPVLPFNAQSDGVELRSLRDRLECHHHLQWLNIESSSRCDDEHHQLQSWG